MTRTAKFVEHLVDKLKFSTIIIGCEIRLSISLFSATIASGCKNESESFEYVFELDVDIF